MLVQNQIRELITIYLLFKHCRSERSLNLSSQELDKKLTRFDSGLEYGLWLGIMITECTEGALGRTFASLATSS